MSGRHRRVAALPEPTPHALLAAVTAAVEDAQSAADEAGFEESVLAMYSDVVWRLHTDRHLVGWRAEPETAWPALAAASAAVLGTLVGDVATRLAELAATTGVALDEPDALAELLVRLAHGVLLVPGAGPEGRAELGAYVQRHVTPLVRSAVDAGPSRRIPPPRRRRMRGELLAASVVAVLLSCAGWVAVVSRSAPTSVTPTNLTGTMQEPERGPSPDPTASGSPAPVAVLPPSSPAPATAAQESPQWTPEPIAPPRASAAPTAVPGDSDGPDRPAGPPPLAGGPGVPPPPGAPQPGLASGAVPVGGPAVSPKAPSAPGSAPSHPAGAPKPNRPGAGPSGHPGGHPG